MRPAPGTVIAALLLGASLSACSSKERQFISGSGGRDTAGSPGLGGSPPVSLNPGTDGGGVPEQLADVPLGTGGRPLSSPEACTDCAPLASLGQLCADDAECASGVCAPDVDDARRCCDRACGDVACERCSSDGSCGALPAFASECPEVTCPSDDVCRDFAQAIAAGTCAEAGACVSAADCTFEWTTAARGGEACDCDASSCALSTTEPCTRNEDCSGAACRATAAGASICCAQPCAPGQVCTADGAGCELEPVCTNGQVRCSSASYQLCTAGQWATQRECGTLGCDVALGGCRRSAGDACTATSECGEGACRQTATGARVCCTAACDTACKLCTASGTGCQFLSDDAACGTVTCPGDTTCRDFPNAVSTNRCISGNCGSPAEVCTSTARNSGQSCSNTALCDGSGNCSVSKKSLGTTCSTATECLSGQCVDGVCCESSCNGPCMACRAGTGRCDVLPADDNACPRVACDVDPECGSAPAASISTNRCSTLGQCKTANDCNIAFAPPITPCEVGSGTFRHCDGEGSCIGASVACGATACAVDGNIMALNSPVCCHGVDASGLPVDTCGTRANCNGTSLSSAPPAQTPVTCDDPSDCRAGTVCCLAAASGGSDLSCRATCNFSNAQAVFFELCRAPGFVGGCPTGSNCTLTLARFPGLTFCD